MQQIRNLYYDSVVMASACNNRQYVAQSQYRYLVQYCTTCTRVPGVQVLLATETKKVNNDKKSSFLCIQNVLNDEGSSCSKAQSKRFGEDVLVKSLCFVYGLLLWNHVHCF